jgi:transposase InsO family protein
MPLIFWLFCLSQWLCSKLKSLRLYLWPDRPSPRYGRRKQQQDQNIADQTKPVYYHRQPKPEWVYKEVIRLKALMPDAGCRTIAAIFNRRFNIRKNMTVGKTYVSNTLRKHQYEIQVLRRKIKHRRPRSIPTNLIWGIDLTGKTDTQGNLLNILSVLEHNSRAALTLTAIKDKTTLTLLQCLLNTIDHFGKPKMIRTDNEAIFTSRLFQIVLWLLGIRHQRIELHCPWQNGRVERFFGTLKEKLNGWEVDSLKQLNHALSQFRFWYHHVRPHQHLNGKTPAEVWNGIDIYTREPDQEYWFEAWDGLLQGYYFRM